MHTPSLEVQERLQQFVRKQRWPISAEDVNEVTWTFNLALSKDELLNYANSEPGSEHIDWRAGKAVIVVRTIDLNGGYTRTTIGAEFAEAGESNDTFATQRAFLEMDTPTANWKQNSAGSCKHASAIVPEYVSTVL